MSQLESLSNEQLRQAFSNAEAALESGDPQASRALQGLALEMQRRSGGSQAREAPRSTALHSSYGPVGQTMGAVTRGLSTVAGAPVDLASWVLNKGRSAVGMDEVTEPVMGSDWINRQLAKDTPIGPLAPEDTGDYPFLTKSGEMAGTALGTLLTMGAGGAAGARTGVGFVDDMLKSSLDELATSPGRIVAAETAAAPASVAAGMYGGDVGEDLGPRVGVSPETGRQVGETAGELIGALTGATAGYGVGEAARRTFSDEGAQKTFRAAERLGVAPSAGLLAPATMAPIENAIATTPLINKATKGAQQGQVQGTSDALERMAGEMAAPAGRVPTSDKAEAGQQALEAGFDAIERLDTKLRDLQDIIYETTGGREAPMPLARVADAISTDLDSFTRGQLDALEIRVNELITAPSANAIDPELDRQLRRRLAHQNRRAKEQGDGLSDQNTLETKLQILSNMTVRNDALENWRKELKKSFEMRPSVAREMDANAYRGIRDTGRVAAADEGQLPVFGAAVDEQRRIKDPNQSLETGADEFFLESLTKLGKAQRPPGSVFNYLTDPNAPGRISAFRRNVPKEEFDATMANVVLRLGDNPSRKAAANEAEFDPGRFLQNWNNLPKQTRDQIIESGEIEQMSEDILTLARALEQRGATGTNSSTFDRGIVAGMGTLLVNNPAGFLITIAMGNAAGRFMISPRVAKALADENPTYAEAIMAMATRRGPGIAAVDSSEEAE